METMELLEVMFLGLLIVCALASTLVRSPLITIITLMAYSVIMSVLWLTLEAPDLAITEAAVGAGVDTILFLVVLKKVHGLHHEYKENKEGKASKERNRSGQQRTFRRIYVAAGILVSLVFLVVLLAAVKYLPLFGDAANPANNEVAAFYLEHGLEDGGATNLVANVILGYRIFDTFGESCVLFLAAASVMILLTRDPVNTGKAIEAEYHREDLAEERAKDSLLRTSTRILLPMIFTYGIYVILNGHLSPGGGFSGGAILGAGLILFAQDFGNAGVKKFFNEHLYHIIKVTALAVYGLVLLYYVFMGVNSLDNHIWNGFVGTILSSGIILPLNFMIGFEVACTIYAFYALFHKGEL